MLILRVLTEKACVKQIEEWLLKLHLVMKVMRNRPTPNDNLCRGWSIIDDATSMRCIFLGIIEFGWGLYGRFVQSSEVNGACTLHTW